MPTLKKSATPTELIFQGINYSKRSLQHRVSREEPTDAAIEAAKIFLSEHARGSGGAQFRLRGYDTKGSPVSPVYSEICSGNTYSGGPWFAGNVCAVRYLGETHSQSGSVSDRYVKYSDDPTSDGHLWLSFILGPESPYIDIFPYLTTLDPLETYAQRGFIFKHLDTMPYNVWRTFCIGMRHPVEFPAAMACWKYLVQEHQMNPRTAFLVSCRWGYYPESPSSVAYFQGRGNSSHSAIGKPFLAAPGIINQEYYSSSLTARSDSTRIAGKFSAEVYAPSRGFMTHALEEANWPPGTANQTDVSVALGFGKVMEEYATGKDAADTYVAICDLYRSLPVNVSINRKAAPVSLSW